MPRQYTHLKEVEAEVFKLKEEGKTNREIAAHFGVTRAQIKGLINRHNRNERKLEQGIVVKPKDRPRKEGSELPLSVQQLSKVTQLQYELAMKERYIKRLEMENELMGGSRSPKGSENKRKIYGNLPPQRQIFNYRD